MQKTLTIKTKGSSQLTLPKFSNDTDSLETFLLLKPYIRPFEKLLARAELLGLMNQGEVRSRFKKVAPNKTSVLPGIDRNMLQKRVAYWERIFDGESHPTWQVMLEKSQNVKKSAHNSSMLFLKESEYHKHRRLRYGPHDLHEYRGKFFPQMVKALINSIGLKENSIVLDPMCGSGTTSCEARAMGMVTLGLDMNPLSVKISEAKTRIISVDSQLFERDILIMFEKLKNEFRQKGVNEFFDASDLNYLRRWFREDALIDVAGILSLLRQVKNSSMKTFYEICLSNILRSISWQSEADLRIRKRKTYKYSAGDAVKKFSNELGCQYKKLHPYLRLVNQINNLKPFLIVEGDAKKIHDSFPSYKSRCDTIITSPPYATALPYLDTDRLSLIVLGLLPKNRHKEKSMQMIGNREVTEKQRLQTWEEYERNKQILPKEITKMIDHLAAHNHKEGVGFRRRNLPSLLAKYFFDMRESFKSALKMIKPGGYAFYIVGNNSTKINGTRFAIETDKMLWELAASVGWEKVKFIDMELVPSRDIFRKNRGSRESILVFKAGDD